MRTFVMVGLVVAIAGVAVAADSATKTRFETAAASSGCASIPYPDLLADCRELHDNKQKPACAKKRRCAPPETKPERGAIQGKVEAKKTEKKAIEKAKRAKLDRIHELEKKVGTEAQQEPIKAQIRADDEKMAALDEEMFVLKRSIVDVIAERRGNAQECRDAREAVLYVFRTSRGQVMTESDPDLEPSIKQIVGKHDASIKEHDQPIKDVTDNLDECDRQMNVAMSDLDAYLVK